MTYQPGDRVYVRAPFVRGEGTVEYVSTSGKVRVRLDATDCVYRAEPRHVTPLDTPTRSPGTLTAQPSYELGEPSAPIDKDAPVRSSAYLDWIRRQPCAYSGVRPVEASHHPREGHGRMSVKTTDFRVLPLSAEVHRQWHEKATIGRMSPEVSRLWVEEQLVEHLSRYLHEVCGVGKVA